MQEDRPTSSYVQALRDALEAKGGRAEISDLGSVRRPDSIGSQKLKAILQAHPQFFTVERHDGTGWTIHQTLSSGSHQGASAPASGGDHRFAEPSMREAFMTLKKLTRQFRLTSWPTRRDQVDVPAQVLWALSRGKYVKVSGGITLSWNQPRIQDAMVRMPPGLFETREVEPEQRPPEQPPPAAPVEAASSEVGFTHVSSTLGSRRLVVVDTEEKLLATESAPLFSTPIGTCAIDCEGVPDALDLIQIAFPSVVYVFDCVKLSVHRVCDCLRTLLTSPTVTKLFHDLHKDVYALAVHGLVSDLQVVFDTQLAAEDAWGDMLIGFNSLMQKLEVETHPTKYAMKAKMQGSDSYWKKRPLQQADVEYAALDATLLLDALPRIKELVGTELEWADLVEASERRAIGAVEHDGARSIAFDMEHDFALASAELLNDHDAFPCEPLATQTDHATVTNLLPHDLRQKMQDGQRGPSGMFFWENVPSPSQDAPSIDLHRLSDVVLDVGRRPQCWVGSERIFLADTEDRLVTSGDVEHVTRQVGTFGSDHRAGMDGKLHRISGMYNRDGRISGLTMRLGRSVKGNADMMIDLLLGSNKSVLVLGEPGSGKTTIIREATRILAQRAHTIVVDTSNEIAGDGMIPHECIGLARRMMVPTLDQQSAVMVECVQNHTPHVMVIDEIGRPKEVNAARTVKQRGVRMIASAHGDLRRLLKNAELQGLVGGVTSVMMGDAMAKEEAKKHNSSEVSKIKAQRGGEPTFDLVIEVQRGKLHEWRVVPDVARAVDMILDGQQYKVQQRTRDPATGSICLELSYA